MTNHDRPDDGGQEKIESMKFAGMVAPSAALKDSFLSSLRSMRAENPVKGVTSSDRLWRDKDGKEKKNLQVIGGQQIDVNNPDELEPHFDDFVAYLESQIDAAGNKVMHWGVDGNGEYIGYMGVYKVLPPERQNVNGHITLELRPSARGAELGNAEAMMEWAFAEEAAAGNQEVMYTCSPDNKGTLGLIRRLAVKGYALREAEGAYNKEQGKQKLKFYQKTTKG